jgi:hypothetical protein
MSEQFFFAEAEDAAEDAAGLELHTRPLWAEPWREAASPEAAALCQQCWWADDACAETVGDATLSDEAIHQALRAHVTPKYCCMIRSIQAQLDVLEREGVVRLEASPERRSNCVWGFCVMVVLDPLRFNQSFRSIVPPASRGGKPLARPTEVFMKTMRFCGVTARRGSRGPADTDPGPRDFMYSYFYDFVPDKEAHNRRKLCVNGYHPELRKALLAKRTADEFIHGTVVKRAKCA